VATRALRKWLWIGALVKATDKAGNSTISERTVAVSR